MIDRIPSGNLPTPPLRNHVHMAGRNRVHNLLHHNHVHSIVIPSNLFNYLTIKLIINFRMENFCVRSKNEFVVQHTLMQDFISEWSGSPEDINWLMSQFFCVCILFAFLLFRFFVRLHHRQWHFRFKNLPTTIRKMFRLWDLHWQTNSQSCKPEKIKLNLRLGFKKREIIIFNASNDL